MVVLGHSRGRRVILPLDVIASAACPPKTVPLIVIRVSLPEALRIDLLLLGVRYRGGY